MFRASIHTYIRAAWYDIGGFPLSGFYVLSSFLSLLFSVSLNEWCLRLGLLHAYRLFFFNFPLSLSSVSHQSIPMLPLTLNE